MLLDRIRWWRILRSRLYRDIHRFSSIPVSIRPFFRVLNWLFDKTRLAHGFVTSVVARLGETKATRGVLKTGDAKKKPCEPSNATLVRLQIQVSLFPEMGLHMLRCTNVFTAHHSALPLLLVCGMRTMNHDFREVLIISTFPKACQELDILLLHFKVEAAVGELFLFILMQSV